MAQRRESMLEFTYQNSAFIAFFILALSTELLAWHFRILLIGLLLSTSLPAFETLRPTHIRIWSIALVALALLAGTSAASSCSCGYSVTSPSSNTTTVYTQLLETDFLHLYSTSKNPCWQPQTYNVTAADARGPQGKLATPKNIVPNPLPSWDTWTGDGILGGDPGLRVWVNATEMDGMVPMGEMVSMRDDMLYGSYRINMKVSGTLGTCGAFFWYRNNSEEIDMEFLSSNLTTTLSPVFLVMQTPASMAAGYNAAGTSTYQIAPLSFTPTTDFHEYRFDWFPDHVVFYADGQMLQTLNWTYPMAPGHLSVNHWSNGNSYWSQGPPEVDAVVTVKYVKAYFNTSDEGLNQMFEEGCGQKEGAGPCLVPEEAGQAVGGGSGNLSTFFFDRGMCGEKVSVKGTGSSVSSSGGTVSAVATTRATSSLTSTSASSLSLSPTSANPSSPITGTRSAASLSLEDQRALASGMAWFVLVFCTIWWFF